MIDTTLLDDIAMPADPDTANADVLRAPSLPLLLAELRVLAEFTALALNFPKLIADLPRGDGHAVMVIPGFGASDINTLPLRRLLRRLGYAAHGWQAGVNLGMRPRLKQQLASQLERLAMQQGRVSLIGWSLGGVFAREMARHQPQHVRRVITLGSPINGRADANNMSTLFRLANLGRAVKVDHEGFRRRIPAPPVPCTAIYSRSDGIVAWPCCREEPAGNTENVEISGSHLGMPYNAQVLRAIADRLAQPVAPI